MSMGSWAQFRTGAMGWEASLLALGRVPALDPRRAEAPCRGGLIFFIGTNKDAALVQLVYVSAGINIINLVSEFSQDYNFN
jgi:hypothetical protein